MKLSHQYNSSELYRIIVPVITGIVIAVTVLLSGFSGEKTNFEEVGLGVETSSFFASYEGYPIHCNDFEDAHLCIDAFNERGAIENIIWFGNSQLHGINQYKVGHRSAPLVLFEQLQRTGFDLVTFSQPNANIHEHYVLFEYIKSYLPVRLLILPVVFDDLRNTGLRSTIAKVLESTETMQSLMKTEIGNQILAEHSVQNESVERAALDGTIQNRFEHKINVYLEDYFALWGLRPEIRGNLFLLLYKLRNFIFNIKATSKRPVIKSRYESNMKALNAIIDTAQSMNIKMLLYIPPIRNDIEIPYVISEYDEFKKEIHDLAINKGVVYLNIEDLVPGNLWGMKDSTKIGGEPEYDFMHFREAGHELLANALFNVVKEEILPIKK